MSGRHHLLVDVVLEDEVGRGSVEGGDPAYIGRVGDRQRQTLAEVFVVVVIIVTTFVRCWRAIDSWIGAAATEGTRRQRRITMESESGVGGKALGKVLWKRRKTKGYL